MFRLFELLYAGAGDRVDTVYRHADNVERVALCDLLQTAKFRRLEHSVSASLGEEVIAQGREFLIERCDAELVTRSRFGVGRALDHLMQHIACLGDGHHLLEGVLIAFATFEECKVEAGRGQLLEYVRLCLGDERMVELVDGREDELLELEWALALDLGRESRTQREHTTDRHADGRAGLLVVREDDFDRVALARSRETAKDVRAAVGPVLLSYENQRAHRQCRNATEYAGELAHLLLQFGRVVLLGPRKDALQQGGTIVRRCGIRDHLILRIGRLAIKFSLRDELGRRLEAKKKTIRVGTVRTEEVGHRDTEAYKLLGKCEVRR